MSIEDYIRGHAKTIPHHEAVVCGEERLTYGQLDERIDQCAGEWGRRGARRGQVVCLRAVSTAAFLIDYFALHRLGCIVAPLERDLPQEAFDRIACELSAHPMPEGTADILYTTGTTGRSKGVMVSHDTILADAENLISGQGFTPELAFVVSGPLNHIGSLSKVYPVMLLGATLIIVDGLKDLNLFFEAFRYPAAKMATFLVPASIRILIRMASNRLAELNGKIDFIETGAAAIAQADMQELCRLLPHSRLYNTYASTETGIISTYNFNDGCCMAGCLGRPMRHSQCFITPEGMIACRGKTLMTGYAGDAARTAEVLREGVLYTADRGMIDSEGMLHLSGRDDDVINVGGFKVSPVEVEDAALSLSSITDCVCVAVPHPLTGQALRLLVVMAEGHALDKRAVARYLKSRLETYKVPMQYEQVEAVRRTFNGKIDRKHYRENVKC